MNKNQERKEEIKSLIVDLHEKLTWNLQEGEQIESIEYIEDMILGVGPKMQYAEDSYIVTKKIEDKTIKEIYDGDSHLIAEVNDLGELEFKEEYIELLRQRYKTLYRQFSFSPKQNFQKLITLNEENEKVKLDKEEIEKQEKEEKQEEKEEFKEDELEQKMGVEKGSIKSCTKLDPTQKITDNKTFQDIVPGAKEFVKIYVVMAKGKKDNARFHFIGQREDGTTEEIEGLRNREGTKTNNSIYCIDNDAIVKEQEVTSLFHIGNTREEGLSVSIEQYGELKVQYIRRSRTENKYIGKYLSTNTQKPGINQIASKETEIREMMDKNRNPYVEDEIERAEARLEESNTTTLENIDDDKNNDTIESFEKRIDLGNDEITTMAREAEDLGISIEQYTEYYEQITDEITDSEKIFRIREIIEKEKEEEEEERERG